MDLQIYYPLLVLQGGLYTARQTHRDLVLREAKHVQFLRQIWTNGHTPMPIQSMLSGIVPAGVLKLVNREIQGLRKRLARQREVLVVSIDRLVAEHRENTTNKVPWRRILQGELPVANP